MAAAIQNISPKRILKIILHDDVIKWKLFPRNWPFVRGIHRSPVNSPHKGQWRGALMFSLICVWINDWVNNRKTADLRHYHAHYDVIVMSCSILSRARQYHRLSWSWAPDDIWAGSRFAPSQWETTLLCNDVFHWIATSLESTLIILYCNTPLGQTYLTRSPST